MSPAGPSLPSGLQELLRRAAEDEGLRRDLLARRDQAAAAAGVDLGPSERAVLRAVPAAQLAQMIAGLADSPLALERREFLQGAGAAAVVLLGGAALGAAALAPDDAYATPPHPPAGIRPDPLYFTGEVDLVKYRTISGPARALPDDTIERKLARGGLQRLPRSFAGTINFWLVVDANGNVTKVTPGKHPKEHEAAIAAMVVDLRWVRFKYARASTTLSFDVALAQRERLRDWSGQVDVVDLDVAGPGADAVRRVVRGLVPQIVARLEDTAPRDRPRAGKLRYALRLDLTGATLEATLTKNTSVQHMVAMGIRQLLADTKFPKAAEPRWCRFSLVLVPKA